MSFIQVTDAKSKIKIDINSDHIICFMPDGLHTKIALINGDVYSVTDTPRSIRDYIGQAQNKVSATGNSRVA